MQQLGIIINQIIMLGLPGLLGFIAGKTRYLPENSGFVISRLIIKITMPLLILTSFLNYKFSYQVLVDGAIVFAAGVIFLALSFFAAVLISDRLHMQEAAKNIYRMSSTFGNVVFLAFPLLTSLFGERGLVYAIFFHLANDALLWTLGIYLVNSHTSSSWRNSIKHFINGNTIAIALGLLSIIVQLQHQIEKSYQAQKIYELFYNTFHPVGKMTVYLSMIFIGLILSEVKIKNAAELAKRYPIFILSFFKLLLIPSVAIGIFLIGGVWINPLVKAVIILQLAMPSGTIVAALAAQYDSDYRFATECTSFTTLLSILTLPLLVIVLQYVGWITG